MNEIESEIPVNIPLAAIAVEAVKLTGLYKDEASAIARLTIVLGQTAPKIANGSWPQHRIRVPTKAELARHAECVHAADESTDEATTCLRPTVVLVGHIVAGERIWVPMCLDHAWSEL